MLVEHRRTAFPLEFTLRVGAAWVIISALMIAVNWSAITTMRFPDPDDTMRLIQVRERDHHDALSRPRRYHAPYPGARSSGRTKLVRRNAIPG